MLEIKNLIKKFGDKTVLHGLSFEVKKGEILGLLGPNGAGKTTTMKIITSFLSSSDGEVILDGKNVSEKSLESRQKIGYLPENVPLYDDFLVCEYLDFIGRCRGISKKSINHRIKEVAHECGLSEVLNRPIDELSKGYRQRVGLATAIIHKPEILILDEPTTGLDPNQIVEIRQLIKKIGQEKTVIFSTHILSEASAICDRIIIINKGKIAAQGTPIELEKQAQGARAYFIKIKGDLHKIETGLKNLESIEKVLLTEKETDHIFNLIITPKKDEDLRETIALKIKETDGLILEFGANKVSLEEVFKSITN